MSCGSCKGNIQDGERALACDDCDRWIHADCDKMSKGSFNIFKNSNYLWFCQNCRPEIKTKIVNLVKVNSNLTMEVEELRARIKVMEMEGTEKLKKVTIEKGTNTEDLETKNNFEKNVFGPGMEWCQIRNGSKPKKTETTMIPLKNKYDKLNETKLSEIKLAKVVKKVREAPSFHFPRKFSKKERDDKGTVLIGDSLVRKMDQEFVARNPINRNRRCFPGAKIETIFDKCKEEIDNTGFDTTHIVLAGGNDVPDKRVKMPNDNLMEKYMEMIKLYKDKNRRLMLVEILPRPGISEFSQDYIYCMNQKLKRTCHEHNITFIETWDSLLDYSLFNRDGIHLNSRGCGILGEILNNAIRSEN